MGDGANITDNVCYGVEFEPLVLLLQGKRSYKVIQKFKKEEDARSDFKTIGVKQ